MVALQQQDSCANGCIASTGQLCQWLHCSIRTAVPMAALQRQDSCANGCIAATGQLYLWLQLLYYSWDNACSWYMTAVLKWLHCNNRTVRTMLAAAIWQLGQCLQLLYDSWDNACSCYMTAVLKWLHCNNRTVGTMLAAAIWQLGQCLQLLYDSCTNGCIATTGQIWAMLAAALWQLTVAHDKRPTGVNRSFSWANRSFAQKKRANRSKNRWANSQPWISPATSQEFLHKQHLKNVCNCSCSRIIATAAAQRMVAIEAPLEWLEL